MIDAIQRYWNERIHDLEMTDHPVGSREFFDDLDEYRFDKLHYLPRLVDFNGFAGKATARSGLRDRHRSRPLRPRRRAA